MTIQLYLNITKTNDYLMKTNLANAKPHYFETVGKSMLGNVFEIKDLSFWMYSYG